MGCYSVEHRVFTPKKCILEDLGWLGGGMISVDFNV